MCMKIAEHSLDPDHRLNALHTGYRALLINEVHRVVLVARVIHRHDQILPLAVTDPCALPSSCSITAGQHIVLSR